MTDKTPRAVIDGNLQYKMERGVDKARGAALTNPLIPCPRLRARLWIA